MNDYSDIIYLTGAMLIFSMLSVQAVQMFNRNDRFKTVTQIEYGAVTLAQDHIDQLRWLKTEGDLDEFVAGFPKTVEVGTGEFTIPYTVSCEITPFNGLDDEVLESKRVEIEVNSIYLNPNRNESDSTGVRMQIVKSFLK